MITKSTRVQRRVGLWTRVQMQQMHTAPSARRRAAWSSVASPSHTTNNPENICETHFIIFFLPRLQWKAFCLRMNQNVFSNFLSASSMCFSAASHGWPWRCSPSVPMTALIDASFFGGWGHTNSSRLFGHGWQIPGVGPKYSHRKQLTDVKGQREGTLSWWRVVLPVSRPRPGKNSRYWW